MYDELTLKYCLDRYKTEGMCDKAADDFLPVLKFVADWFVSSKLIKKLHDALFADTFLNLFSQFHMIIYLMKILVMLHFLVIK